MKSKIRKAYWACYRWLRDLYSPIWYSIFGNRFHIVKTKLTPRVWIDSDERMLYAVMAIVEWFVENDMMGISKEEYEEEIKRVKDNEYNHDQETLQWEIESWNHQYECNCKIMQVYKWWKDYPNRQKEISKALNDWAKVAIADDVFPRNSKSGMTEAEFTEEKRLSDHLHSLEEKLDSEEQEMLKLAVEMRNRMWS